MDYPIYYQSSICVHFMMGMTEIAIMKQTGHKTREMVDRYVQEGLRYKNNASSILKQL